MSKASLGTNRHWYDFDVLCRIKENKFIRILLIGGGKNHVYSIRQVSRSVLE